MKQMDENKTEINDINEKAERSAENSAPAVNEYEGMPKWKASFLKVLPLLITLACVGLFAWGIKTVIGIFYAPGDTVYQREIDGEKFTIVQCYQNPSSHFYIYDSGFTYEEEKYDNVAGEHDDAHFAAYPLVYFILNESAPDVNTVAFTKLIDSNGLYAMQFDEFVLYRLEGQYGVFAPLRDYKESATSRKNDLYVIRQLMKNDRYLAFDLPDGTTQEQFLAMLEKIEWHLDTEYIEDED